MTILSSSTRRDIIRAVEQQGMTPADIQRTYGISFETLHGLRGEGLNSLPDIGRLADYPYIVAIRNRNNPAWPGLAFPDLLDLKMKHDNGYINLTYYHGESMQVMYAFPRAVRAIRKPWFTGS